SQCRARAPPLRPSRGCARRLRQPRSTPLSASPVSLSEPRSWPHPEHPIESCSAQTCLLPSRKYRTFRRLGARPEWQTTVRHHEVAGGYGSLAEKVGTDLASEVSTPRYPAHGVVLPEVGRSRPSQAAPKSWPMLEVRELTKRYYSIVLRLVRNARHPP